MSENDFVCFARTGVEQKLPPTISSERSCENLPRISSARKAAGRFIPLPSSSVLPPLQDARNRFYCERSIYHTGYSILGRHEETL